LQFEVGPLLFECSPLVPQFLYRFHEFRLTRRPLLADGGLLLGSGLRLLDEVDRGAEAIALDGPLLEVELPGREIQSLQLLHAGIGDGRQLLELSDIALQLVDTLVELDHAPVEHVEDRIGPRVSVSICCDLICANGPMAAGRG